MEDEKTDLEYYTMKGWAVYRTPQEFGFALSLCYLALIANIIALIICQCAADGNKKEADGL